MLRFFFISIDLTIYFESAICELFSFILAFLVNIKVINKCLLQYTAKHLFYVMGECNFMSCCFFRERDRYLQKLALGKEGTAIAHSSPVVIIEQYTHCMKALTWSLLNWNFLIWLRGTCEVWSKCLCNSIEIMILRIMDNVLNNYYDFSWVITDCNVGSLLGWKLQITPWKAIPEIIIMISNIVLLILKI